MAKRARRVRPNPPAVNYDAPMDTVWVNGIDEPDGVDTISGTFEVARVPMAGETMEFAAKAPGEMRVVVTVQSVHFDQGEDGKLGATAYVRRNSA